MKGDAVTMQNVFCIILSKYRLYQGIALYRSIAYNYSNFKVFFLCVDDETYQLCHALSLENAYILSDNELEDIRLVNAKATRRLNEYCWTLKPFFLLYVLKKYDFIDNAVSLDADICFFNDPSPIFTNQNGYSVLLSEHAYLDPNSQVEQMCGKYNSGFIVFKKCHTSIKLLEWWAEKCIEWCYDRAEEGRFGDQKYLDFMPHLFEGVRSIMTPGVNIAPWNDDRYHFSLRDSNVYVNDSKLICYHFCGLRLINKNAFALLMGSQRLNSEIHTPYTLVLQEVISDIEKITPGFSGYYVENHFKDRARLYRISRN